MTRGFVGEILVSYRDLGASFRRQQAFAPRESTITAYIMFGSFAFFLSFLPTLFAVDLSNTPDQSLAAGIVMWFFIVMFFLPLVIYGIAGLTRLACRAAGGTGTGYGTRLAIAWAAVVIAPILLMKSILVGALIQTAPDLVFYINLAVLIVGVMVWAVFLKESESFEKTRNVAISIFAVIAGLVLLLYLAGNVMK